MSDGTEKESVESLRKYRSGEEPVTEQRPRRPARPEPANPAAAPPELAESQPASNLASAQTPAKSPPANRQSTDRQQQKQPREQQRLRQPESPSKGAGLPTGNPPGAVTPASTQSYRVDTAGTASPSQPSPTPSQTTPPDGTTASPATQPTRPNSDANGTEQPVPQTRRQPAAMPLPELTQSHADALIRYTGMQLQQGNFREANIVLENTFSLFPDDDFLRALLAISRLALGRPRDVVELTLPPEYTAETDLNAFWPLLENIVHTALGDTDETDAAARRFLIASSLHIQSMTRREPVETDDDIST